VLSHNRSSIYLVQARNRPCEPYRKMRSQLETLKIMRQTFQVLRVEFLISFADISPSMFKPESRQYAMSASTAGLRSLAPGSPAARQVNNCAPWTNPRTRSCAMAQGPAKIKKGKIIPANIMAYLGLVPVNRPAATNVAREQSPKRATSSRGGSSLNVPRRYPATL
jgi:hypothetical protein